MARMLEEETTKGGFPAVLHCYTGGRDLARRAIALGLFISFTGILTFKKSDELRAIAQGLPADRILVETDAPYLAPGRHRGKRNEPAFVTETAACTIGDALQAMSPTADLGALRHTGSRARSSHAHGSCRVGKRNRLRQRLALGQRHR